MQIKIENIRLYFVINILIIILVLFNFKIIHIFLKFLNIFFNLILIISFPSHLMILSNNQFYSWLLK